MREGVVFDIAEGTIHDGPGLRITVFLKGCPLRCRWCHSPEGQDPRPEPMDFGFSRRLAGETWSSWRLAEYLLERLPMIPEGGVTFSGGEPLMQGEFLLEVLERLGSADTMLDTSGHGEYGTLLALGRRVSRIAFGIKVLDDETAKRMTGQGSQVIRENIHRLDRECAVPFYFRIPLVPGVTDTDDNLRELCQWAATLSHLQYVEFLPFNHAAGAKYQALHRPDTTLEWQGREPAHIPTWFTDRIKTVMHA